MFQMGLAHGQGRETNPNGSIRYEGMWSLDVPVKGKKSKM
jgi:MORN repeat